MALPAKPENPNAYGQLVQERAHWDHDIFPAPGSVVGNMRSVYAQTHERGMSTQVEFVKGVVGSLPNPPGQTDADGFWIV
jgi:hypothetical protein